MVSPLFTQRGGWSQGLTNASFNYMAISSELNQYMNGSTQMRRAVEWAFRGTVLMSEGGAMILNPMSDGIDALTGGGEGDCPCD